MSEALKSALARLRSAFSSVFDRLTDRFQRVDATGDTASERPKWLMPLAGFVAFVVVIYYPVGMLFYDTIDDDLDYAPMPKYAIEGGSRAVAMAASLVDRETEYWAANKPFWMPAAALDNMPNFQQGMVSAVSRFAVELGDFLGARARFELDRCRCQPRHRFSQVRRHDLVLGPGQPDSDVEVRNHVQARGRSA